MKRVSSFEFEVDRNELETGNKKPKNVDISIFGTNTIF